MSAPEPSKPKWSYNHWLALGHRESQREPDVCRKCGLNYETWEMADMPLSCADVIERAAQVEERLKKELNENHYPGY
ncbi:MAG TPA: hypothetical protein V6D22_16965 [Candidatus Obscuribacterales bacterium]